MFPWFYYTIGVATLKLKLCAVFSECVKSRPVSLYTCSLYVIFLFEGNELSPALQTQHYNIITTSQDSCYQAE